MLDAAIRARHLVEAAGCGAAIARPGRGHPFSQRDARASGCGRKDIEQDRTRLGALSAAAGDSSRSASLPLQKELWSQAARIEALAELFPWTTSLQSHIEQLRGDIHTLESGLASSSDEPGAKEHRLTGNVPGMSRELVGKLRGPARAMREDSLRLKQARDEQEACQQQIDELQQRLETSLLERGQEELATAVEEAGTLVNRLCRCGQVGERLDQMKRQKQDLAARAAGVAGRPGAVTAIAGVARRPVRHRRGAGPGGAGVAGRRRVRLARGRARPVRLGRGRDGEDHHGAFGRANWRNVNNG